MINVVYSILKGEGLGVRSGAAQRGASDLSRLSRKSCVSLLGSIQTCAAPPSYEEVGPLSRNCSRPTPEKPSHGRSLRRTDSAERRRGGYAFLDLIDLDVAQAGPLVAGGDDRTGAHYVDADSSSLEIHRPGPGERPQSSLGRCKDAEGGIPLIETIDPLITIVPLGASTAAPSAR
jgi:hypothetical protein